MILKKNKRKDEKGKKKKKKLIDPTKAPPKILSKEIFRFKVLFTVKSNRKSKKKFNAKTKSKYIVIVSPYSLYKKNDAIFVVS